MKFLILALLLCGITANAGGSPSKSEISILAFNVENLFDNTQDNANDMTYLPLSKKGGKEQKAFCMKMAEGFYRDECLSLDWNDKIVQTKLDRIAGVVASIDNGHGPDVLIVEEVENIKILTRLMQTINKKLPDDKKYLEPILMEGWDDRGIDVGMMSRLPRAKATTISPVKMNGKIIDSRGILHAVFKLPDGQNLNVFGVHFPSGGNPVQFREAAVVALNAELAKLGPKELAIAGGDFNINAREDAQRKLFPQQLGSKWLVSHLIGCQKCEGTEYFGKDNSWSFLDALLFSKNMKSGDSGWVVDAASVDVPNSGPEQTWKGRPNRFSADYGVSDHWPIYARIRTN